MHEARPGTERPRVHAQYIVALSNLLKPSLDLDRFVSILFTRDLNARLKLADGDCGEMQILVTHGFEPSENRAMWARSAQLRHNIGIEEVHQCQTRPRG